MLLVLGKMKDIADSAFDTVERWARKLTETLRNPLLVMKTGASR